ncbi:MAG: metallophosphoesterase family protein [Ktedonobacterales bacterium]
MRATFVHTADNHLGYEQYGLKERFNDFARAFLAVVDAAIERQADFFVVAGDLFNKRAIDAMTLMQAKTAFERLRDAGIPAIAIEGNHDRSYYRDGISWLQFLCWDGLVQLLNPTVRDGVPEIVALDTQSLRGSYVDLKDGKIRVYGLPWYGASSARVMESFARELAAVRDEEARAGVEYRVLLLHTGVEGIVPQMHGLPTYEQFQPLRGLVDYVGLGHVHKQYERDNWLYNPGSTETWGAEESAWERGFYVVNVNTDTPAGVPRHTVHHVVNPRRLFLRFTCRVDGVPDPTALYERFERDCRQWARENPEATTSAAAPVLDIALSGILSFESSAWDRSRLEETIRQYFEPLTVRIHDGTRDSDYDPFEGDEADGRDRSTWHQLELHIFQELLARDVRYLPNAPQWAAVLADIKQMALGNEDPATIAHKLREARALLAT